MVDWVTIEKFSDDIGMSSAAIQKRVGNKKIDDRKVWPEGLVWIKFQGRIFISRSGWDRWLETARAAVNRQKTANKLNLSSKKSVQIKG